MKIVHLTYTLTYGGIETMLVNIANVQAQTDKVYIVLINDMYELPLLQTLDKRVSFINIGRPVGSKNPWFLFKLNLMLRKISPDIIHVHHPGIIRFMIPLMYHRAKIVFTMHDIPVEEDLKYLFKYKTVYAISKSVQDSLSKIGIVSQVVTNGILPDKFEKRDVYQKHQIFRMVQIGRLNHEKKGQDFMIDVCAYLYSHGYRNFHLDFIGDGSSLEYLQDKVKGYQMEESITFLGAKDQSFIYANLKNYDLFLQPSRREGFGLTVAEAMAAKVPVLVSEQEGPLEIIDNGKYGYYFVVDDVEGCAEKIKCISIQQDLNPLLDFALKRVEENYNVKNTAMKYLNCYRNLLVEER